MSQPNPCYWGIDEPDKFRKAKSKLPREIQEIYFQKITEKLCSENPIDYKNDKWERTRYGRVWMARLNKYWRFSYYVDYQRKKIVLIRIGSHKDVGTE